MTDPQQQHRESTAIPDRRAEEGTPPISSERDNTNDDACHNERKWPEDADSDQCYLRQLYKRWTYSYMGKILRKGSQQTFDDGTHLVQDDLFPVPETMEAEHVEKQFW